MNELLRRLLFLPEQASTLAPEIDALHYVVITVTVLGALGFGVATVWFVIRYRDRGAAPPVDTRPEMERRHVSGHTELVVGGGLLALFVALWVAGFRQYTRIADPPADALPIYVTAKQWMWSFAYPDGSGSIGALYVPAGRPVKLVMTSRDVIHSFFVPAFRLKRDVVPGRSTTMWFEATSPGRYPILCAELCGTGHSEMRAEVIVVEERAYARTLQQLDRQDGATLAAVGERIAARRGCLRCHTADGTPHLGPTWAGLYAARIPLADGTEVTADEAYLTSSMMDPMAQLHRGFAPVMPSYQGQVTAPEVGAIVEYIRSLRDAPRRRAAEPLPTTPDLPPVTPLPGEPLPAPGPQRSIGGPP